MRGAVLVSLLVLGSALLASAGKKKDAPPPTPDRMAFDIRKIVWPNPPAVARIKFVDLFTGEKIDFAAMQAANSKKKKKSWMDRLAGADASGGDSNAKVPYQLIRPYGIAVDSKGKIYAADEGVDAVFIFDPATRGVEFIRNDHEAHFGLINGLAIDDNDRLFVSDGKLHKILTFNAKHEQEGSFGTDALARPGGIAIDRENRFLYVVDTEADQVVVFDADKGTVLRKIGVTGKKHTLTEPGTFSLPSNVALDKDGNVYVSDTLNNRIEIFDADGNFVSMFGKHGDGPGYFARPKGIAIDSDGHIWVVDAYQDRVQVFDREGRLLIFIGGHGNYPGQFNAAYGIAIDAQNRVITSEQYPGRLQVFQYVTDAEAAAQGKNPGEGDQPAVAPAKDGSTAQPTGGPRQGKDGNR